MTRAKRAMICAAGLAALVLGLVALQRATRKPGAVHYYSECSILDRQSKLLRRLPGLYCIFLENGDLVSSDPGDATHPGLITYFDRHMRIKWWRKLTVHHNFNLSLDAKSIYALVQETRGDTRYDLLYELDLSTGDTLGLWDTATHLTELEDVMGLPRGSMLKEWRRTIPGEQRSAIPGAPHWEYSHFNSIRDVPPNEKGFFKPGQVIVNACCFGKAIVFDHDLRAPLFSVAISRSEATHSASVTAEGNLLFFRNSHFDAKENFSSVEEYDPVEKRIVWYFRGVDGHVPFFAAAHGYIEKIAEDRYMFSANDVAYEIDRAGKVYWRSTTPPRQPFFSLMPIRKGDLSGFLRNNEN
ncbi:MAG: hypothetical protein HY075_03880 [Deltaproteobacteria bacterium]|nr:hypothetical protein [Deltaproteobacteria bacterium]